MDAKHNLKLLDARGIRDRLSAARQAKARKRLRYETVQELGKALIKIHDEPQTACAHIRRAYELLTCSLSN